MLKSMLTLVILAELYYIRLTFGVRSQRCDDVAERMRLCAVADLPCSRHRAVM